MNAKNKNKVVVGKAIGGYSSGGSGSGVAAATPGRRRISEVKKDFGGGVRTGRTLTAEREQLEKASERFEARKKGRAKRKFRIGLTTCLFALVGVVVIWVVVNLVIIIDKKGRELTTTEVVPYLPTVEIIDETTGKAAEMSERMRSWVGQMESDFRELGYKPIKVVLPIGVAKEMDFYFEDFSGYVKVNTDRLTGVSAEDMDRMVRYLNERGISFSYIDVRVDRKGFYK